MHKVQISSLLAAHWVMDINLNRYNIFRLNARIWQKYKQVAEEMRGLCLQHQKEDNSMSKDHREGNLSNKDKMKRTKG